MSSEDVKKEFIESVDHFMKEKNAASRLTMIEKAYKWSEIIYEKNTTTPTKNTFIETVMVNVLACMLSIMLSPIYVFMMIIQLMNRIAPYILACISIVFVMTSHDTTIILAILSTCIGFIGFFTPEQLYQICIDSPYRLAVYLMCVFKCHDDYAREYYVYKMLDGNSVAFNTYKYTLNKNTIEAIAMSKIFCYIIQNTSCSLHNNVTSYYDKMHQQWYIYGKTATSDEEVLFEMWKMNKKIPDVHLLPLFHSTNLLDFFTFLNEEDTIKEMMNNLKFN